MKHFKSSDGARPSQQLLVFWALFSAFRLERRRREAASYVALCCDAVRRDAWCRSAMRGVAGRRAA